MTSSSSGQDTASPTTTQTGFDAGTQFQTLVDGIEQSVFMASALRAKGQSQAAQPGSASALHTTTGEQLTALSPTSGLGAQLYLAASKFAGSSSTTNALAGGSQAILGYAETNLSLVPSNDLVVGFLGGQQTPAALTAFGAGLQPPSQVSASSAFEPVQAGLQNLIQAMATFTAGNSAFNAFTGTPASLVENMYIGASGQGPVGIAPHGAWMGGH